MQAVLWDVTGVFTGSPFHGIRSHAEQIGLDPDDLLEWVLGYASPDGDHPWHRVERGEAGIGEAVAHWTQAAAAQGHQLDVRALLGAFTDGEPDVRQPVVEKVRTLRDRGLRQGILTNNIKENTRWRQSIPLELFDVVVDSCEVGVRKPSPAIYEIALERFGVPAGETVFLDDYEGNVEAARSLGIHGILVGRAYQSALDQLDELLN